jgi:hypothetical protein
VRLNVHPFVSTENRDAWQEYTARHNAWVDESMHIQMNDDTMYKGPVTGEFKFRDVIHDNSELDKNPSQAGGYGTNRTGPYLPSWQASPVIPDADSAVYNLDLYGAHLHKSAIQALQDTHQVSIMEAYMIPDYGDPEQLAETEVLDGATRHTRSEMNGNLPLKNSS